MGLSWALLGALGAFLGHWCGVLGRSWGALNPSWGALGASWGALEALLDASWALLDASWGKYRKNLEWNAFVEATLKLQMDAKIIQNRIKKTMHFSWRDINVFG